jgi:ketosteroid isomerase-like protein
VTDERVTVLRRGIDAWNRGDLDGILRFFSPDVEIRLSGAFPGLKRDYRGHEGYREFWHSFREMWSTLQVELVENEPVGDLLLSTVRFHGRGREGIDVEQSFYFLWEFSDDGRTVTAYRAYPSHELAQDAANEAREKGGLAV